MWAPNREKVLFIRKVNIQDLTTPIIFQNETINVEVYTLMKRIVLHLTEQYCDKHFQEVLSLNRPPPPQFS